MKNKKFKINLFDIVIIILVLVVAVFAYKYTHKETAVETKNIKYTFELIDNPSGFSDLISVGDEITDNIKNYYMGKVVEVKTVPYTRVIQDRDNGVLRESVVEGRETAIVTVEGPVTESTGDFKVNGYFTVKAGLEVAVKGNGYAGRGYILNVERQEAAR